ASSPPSADRFHIAAPLPAGSAPPRTLPVVPERIAPRLSSPAPCPMRAKGHCCRIFTPAQPVYPAASLRDFLSGALTLGRAPQKIVLTGDEPNSGEESPAPTVKRAVSENARNLGLKSADWE